MRIVHTETVESLSGQPLRLIAEARALSAAGHACTVVGPAETEFHRRAAEGIDFRPFRFAKRDPRSLARARRLLSELAPDVVHTHSSRDAWLFGLAARSLGIPIVRGRHIARALPRSFLSRLVYTRLADAFTASGETIARMLVEARVAKPEAVWVTPAGIDFERFDARARDPAALRAELGLDPRARLVGTTCNRRAQKGVGTLLDAFCELEDESAVLLVAGKGDPAPLAARAGRAGGRVRFLGFRDDIERVLGALELFVLASSSDEGVPQAILQAMALRVPVLATRAGGIPDVVRAGETGFLVPPDDARALSTAMRGLLAVPPPEAVLDSAWNLVRDTCSLDAVVARYLEAYAYARNCATSES
ncbi:MAG TPA: glycosyltransferase family 4 protein [Planctomycetota bacterium]|nr:glycosyltransferase family 4 protein [Planctomycetota bacterium]